MNNIHMHSLNVLFWNIGKKNLSPIISHYCDKYNVDILVLAENEISHVDLLQTLNSKTIKYSFCKGNDRGIAIFTSFRSELYNFLHTKSQFISMVEFRFANKSVLFGAVHLPSKLTDTTIEQQCFTARILQQEIVAIEDKIGNKNTILVGDFNMNPFEAGMVQADAFNAVMCRTIASMNERAVSGLGTGKSIRFPYFYNPMWSFMGDLSKYTSGTYYHYGNGKDNNYRWNMMDQVLIRPSLIPTFDVDSIEIIEIDNNGKKLIDTTKASRGKYQVCDHLPIRFKLDLTK